MVSKEKGHVAQHTIQPVNKPSRKKRKYTTKSGVVVRLTPMQKKYADTKLANPDMALVDVAQEAYPAAAQPTLRQIANINEKNKDITIYTEEQISQAAITVVEIMNDEKVKADTRLKAADSMLDRAVGKPVQRQVTQNTSVNLNVAASKELSDNFTAFLKANTAT